jgi:hypothetical protein
MSKDMVYEEVPQLDRRAGDNVLAGMNNSTILLGRDRLGSTSSGYGDETGSGAIHLMVGRVGRDPSPKDDKATVFVSAKTDPDKVSQTIGLEDEDTGVSGVVLRGDCLRFSARTSLKVSVGRSSMTFRKDGSVTIEGSIKLGSSAVQKTIMADEFSRFWNTISIPTPAGPSGPPPPIPSSVFTSKVLVE